MNSTKQSNNLKNVYPGIKETTCKHPEIEKQNKISKQAQDKITKNFTNKMNIAEKAREDPTDMQSHQNNFLE